MKVFYEGFARLCVTLFGLDAYRLFDIASFDNIS